MTAPHSAAARPASVSSFGNARYGDLQSEHRADSIAGASQTRLVTVLMLIVCGLGATMSSTAVTAIFIPVVMRICRRTGISQGNS